MIKTIETGQKEKSLKKNKNYFFLWNGEDKDRWIGNYIFMCHIQYKYMYIHCVRQNNDHPKMSMSSQESEYLRLHGKERIQVADHLTLRWQATLDYQMDPM